MQSSQNKKECYSLLANSDTSLTEDLESFLFIDIRFDSEYDFLTESQAAATITTPYQGLCGGGGGRVFVRLKRIPATQRDDDKYEHFSNLGRPFPHGVEMYLDMGDIVE